MTNNNDSANQSNRDKYVEKVKKLLAKAESAGTEAEAEAFFAKVTELMAEWEIDDAELRDRGQASTSDGVDEMIVKVGSYTPKADASAMNSIIRAMGLRGGFSPYASGRPAYMRILGRESNLERFTMMWTSINLQMVMQMKKQEPKGVSRGDLRTWRQSFKMGYCATVGQRIKEVRAGFGSALVRVDEELTAKANSEFGQLKRSSIKTNYAASSAGQQAGRNADINNHGRVAPRNQKALGA
jgi:hypothetical protein